MSARAAVKAPATTGAAQAAAKSAARPAITPVRTPLLQRACACGEVRGTGGKCSECEKKDTQKVVQRASTGGMAPPRIPPVVNQALDSPGHPLDGSTRDLMESRFGHDFGRVRVHDDALAAESARAVNARAYTVGQDIVFDSARFSPGTDSGRHLLAHELAHTIQQGGVHRYANDLQMGGAMESHLEREAEHAAQMVGVSQPPAPAATPWVGTRMAAPVISRVGEDKPTPATAGAEGAGDEEPALAWEDVPAGNPLSKIAVAQSKLRPGVISPKIRAFKIKDPFPLPKEKGPVAARWQERAAAGALESVVDFDGNPKAKLKQERPDTDTLRKIWLTRVGWTKENAAQNWEAAGGDKAKTFEPKAGKNTCEMDHVIELQIGGNNTTENILPLDREENGASGREIFKYLKTKAQEIRDLNSVQQILLHFDSVTQASPTCNICCQIAQKADALSAAAGSKPTEDPTEPYEIKAGSSTELQIPAGSLAKRKTAPKIPIADSENPKNKAGSTLIPGMVLQTLRLQPKMPDIIDAFIDTENKKTRLPITIDKEKGTVHLLVLEDHQLKLQKKTTNIAFTYPYLSPGTITEISVDETGDVSWKGTIKPNIPLIGPLGVEYSKGALLITKGLEEEALKKKSFLGMKVTKAQLQLQLAPQFEPAGVIEAQIGEGEKPLAKIQLKVTADSVGLVATGDLSVNIPKMKSATSTVTYKGGGGRNEWTAEIHIKSEDIQLGSSVSVTGGFDGTIDKGGINFTGKISATFPGNNTAELGLKKSGTDWVLFGGGKFHFPKLDETTVAITYHLGKDVLVATGTTGFTIPQVGLSGKLNPVTFTIAKGEDVKVSGKGSLDFVKGKASGHVDVTLHPSGLFTGKGTLTYKIKENIIVSGTVELDDKQKLHVSGELTITRYELFKQHGDKKDLFTLDIPVPVPGLSIGTTGLVFHIKGGVGVAYSFGPGTIEPLIFSAKFDPLEDDPNFEAEVRGSVKVPASATLSAFISGSLAVQVDVYVGSAGAEAGLKLTGEIILSAGAFANFKAAYKQKKLSAHLDAGIEAKLLLGLSLTAFARAWAGAFGISGEVRKDWTLARKVIDTQLGFYLSAPFDYADDTGIKLPSLDDITLKKPELTTENLKRILGEIFGSSSEKTAES